MNVYNQKVSVIIPIYNSESYMCRSIDSVLKQTYSNFELILVDDGSCDRSFELCECYAKQDNRIKIYRNKINKGASFARNIGLEKSTGDYIIFVDSDNWIEYDLIQLMVDGINKYNGQLICSSVFEDGKAKYICQKDKIILKDDLVDSFFDDIGWSVCAKMYSKELLNNRRFDTGLRTGEDLLFTWNVINDSCLNKIILLSIPLYHIETRPDSLGHSRSVLNWISFFSVSKRISLDTEKIGKMKISKLFKMKAVGTGVSLVRMMLEEEYPKEEVIKYINFIRKNKSAFFLGTLTLKLRMGMVMMCLPYSFIKCIFFIKKWCNR